MFVQGSVILAAAAHLAHDAGAARVLTEAVSRIARLWQLSNARLGGITGLSDSALGPPARWIHPTDFAPTQALGAAARETGIAVIRVPSARRAGGINAAVLDPLALVASPRPHSSWAFLTIDNGPIAIRELSSQALHFTPAQFDLV